MFLSPDGDMGDFCCSEFENYSLKPTKAIGFDLMYKKYDNDKPEPKAFIYFQKGSGVATQQGFQGPGSSYAGQSYVVINRCPWCGSEIEFT